MSDQSLSNGSPEQTTRIAIFDDSEDALGCYVELLKKHSAHILAYKRPHLDPPLLTELEAFQPQLIIVDLLMDQDQNEGYRLMREIHKVDFLQDVPLVVCSNLINNSLWGRKERQRCVAAGATEVFGKIESFPEPEELLNLAQGSE